MNRSQLKFHETFQPEFSYIAKIMSIAADHFQGSKFDISNITGIPTGKQKGKVEPSIKYATFMGLTNYTVEKGVYSLSLTPIGAKVFSEDPYLHEKLTHWACHYNMSRIDQGAPQWSFIIRSGHQGFIADTSSTHLLAKAVKFFNIKVSFEELFGVVKRSYSEGCFSGIAYLQWDDRVQFIEHNENKQFVFLYAYAILSDWETHFPSKNEITMIELQNTLSVGKVFGLNENELSDMLDTLSSEGILTVNRQLFPATIVRRTTSSDIIPLLYSRLL